MLYGDRFALIRSINIDRGRVHIQWFEHGKNIVLQEFALEQELFLATGQPCSSEITFAEVIAKVDFVWDPSGRDTPTPSNYKQFFCR